ERGRGASRCGVDSRHETGIGAKGPVDRVRSDAIGYAGRGRVMSKVVKTRRSRKRSVARLGPTPNRHFNQVTAHEVLVPNRREVLAYCRAHPFLARELPRIAARARAFFGTDAELLLVLYRDPEIDDRYLTMYVRTDPL